MAVGDLDLHAALQGAEDELIARLTDPVKRSEMSDGVIIRAIEVLNRRLPPRPQKAEAVDEVTRFRAMGLPSDRLAELLAQRIGITTDEARNLLDDNGGQEEA